MTGEYHIKSWLWWYIIIVYANQHGFHATRRSEATWNVQVIESSINPFASCGSGFLVWLATLDPLGALRASKPSPHSHGKNGVPSGTRRRRPPVRGRGGGPGGEAGAHSGRPARRNRRRGGRRVAPLRRALVTGLGPWRWPAAWSVKDGSGRPPGRAPPRPNRPVVRLREAPPWHHPLTGADPSTSIAATAARSSPRLTLL